MNVGRDLRRQALEAPDLCARGGVGGWSIVLSAPGYMGRPIPEWWLTAKWQAHGEPGEDDRRQLRAVVAEAGGDGSLDPEQVVLGSLLWRWGAPADEDLRAAYALNPEQKVGRNDPCPCGSGRKFKKCCSGGGPGWGSGLGANVCDGPGSMSGRCGGAVAGRYDCRICSKPYWHCRRHAKHMETTMRGHVMRAHPETLSHRQLDQILDDRAIYEGVETQHAASPALWEKLWTRLEARRRDRAS